MKLHRYWLEFDCSTVVGPAWLRLGCGVTAYGLEDARAIVQATVFEGREMPAITKAIEDVDIKSLDQRHVIPNMGVVTWRGVWFPLGYAR